MIRDGRKEKKQAHKAFRFILAYRKEVTDVAGQEGQWRGWVVRVPDAGWSNEPANMSPVQLWFKELDEIPDAIRQLMQR